MWAGNESWCRNNWKSIATVLFERTKCVWSFPLCLIAQHTMKNYGGGGGGGVRFTPLILYSQYPFGRGLGGLQSPSGPCEKETYLSSPILLVQPLAFVLYQVLSWLSRLKIHNYCSIPLALLPLEVADTSLGPDVRYGGFWRLTFEESYMGVPWIK
jgi:hypothetical protein